MKPFTPRVDRNSEKGLPGFEVSRSAKILLRDDMNEAFPVSPLGKKKFLLLFMHETTTALDYSLPTSISIIVNLTLLLSPVRLAADSNPLPRSTRQSTQTFSCTQPSLFPAGPFCAVGDARARQRWLYRPLLSKVPRRAPSPPLHLP